VLTTAVELTAIVEEEEETLGGRPKGADWLGIPDEVEGEEDESWLKLEDDVRVEEPTVLELGFADEEKIELEDDTGLEEDTEVDDDTELDEEMAVLRETVLDTVAEEVKDEEDESWLELEVDVRVEEPIVLELGLAEDTNEAVLEEMEGNKMSSMFVLLELEKPDEAELEEVGGNRTSSIFVVLELISRVRVVELNVEVEMMLELRDAEAGLEEMEGNKTSSMFVVLELKAVEVVGVDASLLPGGPVKADVERVDVAMELDERKGFVRVVEAI